MTREIALTQGYVAIVDNEDFDRISAFKWRARTTGGLVYAVTTFGYPGPQHTIYMHRMILDARTDETIDHRDANGLNNTRENLRHCTQSENIGNSRIGSRNSSGFKGVSMDKRRGTWRARIANRQVGGAFATAQEAARAYDTAAFEKWGNFARLNFPGEPLRPIPNRLTRSRSGFKGVSFEPRTSRYYAQVGSPSRYIGTFDTAEEAARAHDAAARQLHGAAARVNFPD